MLYGFHINIKDIFACRWRQHNYPTCLKLPIYTQLIYILYNFKNEQQNKEWKSNLYAMYNLYFRVVVSIALYNL